MNKLASFDIEHLRLRTYFTGVDEAGRGALAGPVCAAAFLADEKFYDRLDDFKILAQLNDSKQLKSEQRDTIYFELIELKKKGIVDFEWAFASVEEIEKINILEATKLAMKRALDQLNNRNELNYALMQNRLELFESSTPNLAQSEIFVDGKPLKNFKYKHFSIIKGDSKSFAIAAASVVAKVNRDKLMIDLAKTYKHYAIEQHKGYATALHCERLSELGLSPIHRKSFVETMLRHKEEKAETQAELF
ncbi:MAG: ribonuclease HII [Opitutales bacterium]